MRIQGLLSGRIWHIMASGQFGSTFERSIKPEIPLNTTASTIQEQEPKQATYTCSSLILKWANHSCTCNTCAVKDKRGKSQR